MIGVFGVAGGTLFVPALLQLPGMTPAKAVGTTMVATIPMNLLRVGQLVYFGRLRFRSAAPMMLGAAIASCVGQFIVQFVSKLLLSLVVAFMAAFCGCQILMKTFRKWRASQQATASQKTDDLEQPSVDDEQQNAASKEQKDADDEQRNVDPKEENVADDQQHNVDDKKQNAIAREQENTREIDQVGVDENRESADDKEPKAVHDEQKTTDDKRSVGRDEKKETNAWHIDARKLLIGLVGGLISSIAGLGGPVVLMPLFMLTMPPVDFKHVIAITSPTAGVTITVAGITSIFVGEPDIGLALVFSVALCASALTGGVLQEKLPSAKLLPVVGCLLLVVAVMLVVQRVLTALT
eukprot:TRINITY_DN10317_c0_g1_i1.p1 TRINITY_DN10317_c0_g1~~TRINITY_DN10317_c0_g1_i1.p1  ORF type:complete len:397 (-),score=60.29 TRINITY_DN10317_c0_g1_i1:32-1087(-)